MGNFYAPENFAASPGWFRNLEFKSFGAQGSPCIDYRNNNHCSGDLIQSTTIEPSPNGPVATEYEAVGGYGVCASLCIGVSGCVSFNWSLNSSGSGNCELYSSG